MENCIFCKIISGEIPSTRIYEDDMVLAFLDINPINPGHTLVIPKKHFAILADMESHYGGPIWEAGRKIASALRKADIGCEGVNFFLADGAAAGQEVLHVHLHIIPRNSADRSGFRFPHDRKKPEGDEWNKIAEAIRTSL
jgi:histidine triad (HIT) family protein